MNARICGFFRVNWFVAAVLAVALFPTSPALSADPGDPSTQAGQPATTVEQVSAWVPRLVGKFRVEGSFELPGKAGLPSRESIRGQADCRSIMASSRIAGRAPAVECFLDMQWTPLPDAGAGQVGESAPTHHTALLVYGYELSAIGLRYMLVDDAGVAESGAGQLIGNTLVSTSRCARIAEGCQQKVRITAGSELDIVRMTMDMEVNGQKVGGREMTLYREPAAP